MGTLDKILVALCVIVNITLVPIYILAGFLWAVFWLTISLALAILSPIYLPIQWLLRKLKSKSTI